MKKFFATATANVFATTVSASNILATPALAQELIRTALVEGTNYIISGDAKLAAEVQAQFMDTVNDMINAAEEIGNTDALDQAKENGAIAKDVYEFLIDQLEARKNPLLSVKLPAKAFTIAKGVNMKEAQVKAAFAAQGIVIDGPCTIASGEAGTVKAIEVGNGFTIAYVQVGSEIRPLAINTIKGLAAIAPVAKEVAPTNQTKTNEEVSTMTTTNNKSNVSNSAREVAAKVLGNINPAIQAQVEEALKTGVDAFELTAEQRQMMQDHKLATDVANAANRIETKAENASALANSSVADQLLAMLGSAPAASSAVPAVQAQAPVANAAPIVAPATPNTNQTTGGNVQMNNTNNATVFTPATAVSAQQAPASATPATGRTAMSHTAALIGGMQINPALATGGVVTSNTIDAWNKLGIKDKFNDIVGEDDQYTGRNAKGQLDYVWYVEEAKKYEGQIMTATDMAAQGWANPTLGITNIAFYSPQDVYATRGTNFTARPEEYKVAEVFFGMTSYTFMIRKGIWTDKETGVVTPWINSANIVRVKKENGTGYFCEYQANRRSDVLDVVVQADGKVRLARTEWKDGKKVFVAEDAPYVQQVGGGKHYVQAANAWDVKVGQAVMLQVLMVFDELTGLKDLRAERALAAQQK